MTLSNVIVEDNQVIGGDGAPGTDGTGPGRRPPQRQSVHLGHHHRQPVQRESARGGRGGDAPSLGGTAGNGADGQGGGIYNSGQLTLTSCRISGNTALGGQGGSGDVSPGGIGGNGIGGGVVTVQDPYGPPTASLAVDHITITGNAAIGGLGGSGVPPGADGVADSEAGSPSWAVRPRSARRPRSPATPPPRAGTTSTPPRSRAQ